MLTETLKQLRHWAKYTIKQKTSIRVYQAWLMMIVTAISATLITFLLVKPDTYKVKTEYDKWGKAINCYQTSEELRCYVDMKVKQYGRMDKDE